MSAVTESNHQLPHHFKAADGRDIGFMYDTSLEMQRVYYALLKTKTPEFRISKARELFGRVREAAKCGIRQRHPDYTEEQVRLSFLKLIMKDEEFKTLFPAVHIER